MIHRYCMPRLPVALFLQRLQTAKSSQVPAPASVKVISADRKASADHDNTRIIPLDKIVVWRRLQVFCPSKGSSSIESPKFVHFSCIVPSSPIQDDICFDFTRPVDDWEKVGCVVLQVQSRCRQKRVLRKSGVFHRRSASPQIRFQS